MEVFHETIYNNLCLLKEKGHRINFEQGMFRHRNQPGFEKVGYGLLMVIDPTECNKTIPWPLCNDKTAKNDFRINFVKFIKLINEKHPDAQIPEMTASNLQHPGGEKFLRFMHKLSSFAIKLEIRRMMGADREKTLLPYPESPNLKSFKESGIKLNIVKGSRCQMEHSVCGYSKLDDAAVPKLQQLKAINNRLASEVNTVKAKLGSEILKLATSEEYSKERLHDLEDQKALSDWNRQTEEKIKRLESMSQRLREVREMTAKSCQLVRAVERTHSDTLCLDGSQLLIPQSVSELAGTPVMNTRGQVRLEVLLKAGAEAARRLVPSPNLCPQSPLLPLARNLLTNVQQQREAATSITECLLDLVAESEEAIKKQIPIISAKMEKKELSDHLKCLEDRPALQFICDDAKSTVFSPLEKRKRMSLNSMANLHVKKENKVICSVRKRRSVSKYSFEQTPRQLTTGVSRFGFRVPLTSLPQKFNTLKKSISRKSISATSTTTKDVLRNPTTYLGMKPETTATKQVFKTPVCKRSIYGKLPQGLRTKDEDFAELPSPNPVFPFSSNSFSETSPVVDSQTCSALADVKPSTSTEHFEVASPPKKPRKSFLDLVERYKKVVKSMKTETPTIKSEK